MARKVFSLLLVGMAAVLVAVALLLPVVSADPLVTVAPEVGFVPVVLRQEATALPTATATPTNTATHTPMPTATAVGPGNVRITRILYNGVEWRAEGDEFVEIVNFDGRAVELGGWTLADAAGKTFQFPAFLMEPGQVCRVYTDEVHPEWCGFSYGSGRAIWNNDGDTATLRDGSGTVIDTCTYSGGGDDGAIADC